MLLQLKHTKTIPRSRCQPATQPTTSRARVRQVRPLVIRQSDAAD